MLEEHTVTCPYCGEPIVLVVDCSAGDQRYTEDCFVCCQPIDVTVEIAADGTLAYINAVAENG
jgi:transcription elongation factor Elf1